MSPRLSPVYRSIAERYLKTHLAIMLMTGQGKISIDQLGIGIEGRQPLD